MQAAPDDLFSLSDEDREETSEDPFGFEGAKPPQEEASFGFSSSSQVEEDKPKPTAPDPSDGADLFDAGDDPLGLSATPTAPEEPEIQPAQPEEDAFDLFSPESSLATPEPEEERVDDLFGPLTPEEKSEESKPDNQPKAKTEEEDIFGFGSYFESDEEKDR